jgi:hypothetical protein
MDWGIFVTVVGTGCAIAGFLYQIMRNFREDINKNFEKHERRFEMLEKRFEMIDQRLFLLCIGKSLPEILKAEREGEKK